MHNGLTISNQEKERDILDVVDELILKSYLELLKASGRPPSIYDVTSATVYNVEVGALDVIYGKEILSLISNDVVFEVLTKGKHCCQYFGKECYSAQQLLFKNLYSEIMLLGE